MISRTSKFLAMEMSKTNIISPEDLGLYEYDLSIIHYQILHITLIIAISHVKGYIVEYIIFVLLYILLRPFVGGYHAKSSIMCLVISLFIVSGLYL